MFRDVFTFFLFFFLFFLGIVNIQLQRVQERIRDRNMTLSISPRATSWLADEGYNPLYGARPLKRVIQVSHIFWFCFSCLSTSSSSSCFFLVLMQLINYD